MKEFIIFVYTDSAEIFFSKLRSTGLKNNLPSFSLNLTVRGVSKKHCLLTFFISTVILLPSADSRRAVVSRKRKYVHEVLVSCFVNLAQEKSLAR